jgi:hypothetical protein
MISINADFEFHVLLFSLVIPCFPITLSSPYSNVIYNKRFHIHQFQIYYINFMMIEPLTYS